LELPAGKTQAKAQVTLAGKALPAKLVATGSRAEIRLEDEALLDAGQSLEVILA
jgi:hypothetical protein